MNPETNAKPKPDGTLDLMSSGVVSAALAALNWLQENGQVETVADWVETVAGQKGRMVLSGMGKSGLIAQKISATFASTGTPSFFMHPAEASHGDLGMLMAEDSLLLLSNSGESEEILRLLPSLARMGISTASITSNPNSTLGQSGRWCFSYQLPEGEGCPIELAPMASTTMQIIWGDVLAACLMKKKGFTPERFAELHPGGSLGAKLLKIIDLMHIDFPSVAPEASFSEILAVVTKGKLGMTAVVDGKGLLGVISDGDIRRTLEKVQQAGGNPLDLQAKEMIGSRHPHSIEGHRYAVEAARIMEAQRITFLFVVMEGKPCGVIHIHDLLGAKVI